MASTKEMQARAKARKQAKQFLHNSAQTAARLEGYPGIDMQGSSSFINSASRIMTATPGPGAERFNSLARLFVAEAQKYGGAQAAEEMQIILEEQRKILLQEAAE
jgi:hypothetical protein